MSLTLKAFFPNETFVVPVSSHLDYPGLLKLIPTIYPSFFKKDFEICRFSPVTGVVGAPIVSDDGLTLAISDARLLNKPLYLKIELRVVPGSSSHQDPQATGAKLFESVKLRADALSEIINPIMERRRRAFAEPEIVEREAAELEKLKRCAFVQNLNSLEEMGFTNRDLNIEVLVQHRGDLLQAVRQLVGRSNILGSIHAF
jgi:hypothetical protein